MQLHFEYENRTLIEINEEELKKLEVIINEMNNFITNEDTHIFGFGFSYLSALLSFYFPNLLPIIDKRILLNLEFVTQGELMQKQVKNINEYYIRLLNRIREELSKNENRKKTLRDFDKQFFTLKYSLKSKEKQP